MQFKDQRQMSRYIPILSFCFAILPGLFFFIDKGQAQEPAPAGDTIGRAFSMEGELELRTGDNLDSLLNLWYVNQALESATDDYLAEADTLMPDFSDSVYIQRLAEIPSVVDLTYNRIVKNYIF